MADKKTHRTWRILLLVASACYLPIELVVNSSLVSIAGGTDASRESLESLELFGRTVSAFGFTLLLISMLTRSPSIVRNVANAAVIAVFAWPAAFVGQKALIDEYIVDPSTAEQRQQAYGSRMIRTAVESGALEIEGLSYEKAKAKDPAQMTFMTVFGGLIYIDPLLMENIKLHAPVLIEQHVRRRADESFEEVYGAYSAARDEMLRRYDKYKELMTAYRKGQKKIPSAVVKQASKAELKIEDARQAYLNAELDYERKTAKKAEEMAPLMYRYFKKRHDKYCKDRCQKKLQSDYEVAMRSNGLAGTPPSYWLVREELTTGDNVKDMAFEAVGTLGLSLLAAGIDKLFGGNGGWEDERFYYTDDAKHYKKQLIQHEKNLAKFERQVGIPYGLSSKDAFMDNAAAGAKISAQFARSDIRLPKGWKPYESQRLRQAIHEMLDRKLQADLKQQIVDSGVDVPLGINWYSFQRHSSVQDAFKQILGPIYRKPVLLDWNNVQFQAKVVEPSIRKESKRLIDAVQASTHEFGEGGELEDEGKHALRSVVVPPIAMAVSLFLSIATAVRLVVEIASPWLHRKVFAKQAAFALLMTIIVAAPLATASRVPENNDKVTSYFIEVLKNHSHPAPAYALQWTLSVQPVIYPIGNTIDELLGVYKGEGDLWNLSDCGFEDESVSDVGSAVD